MQTLFQINLCTISGWTRRVILNMATYLASHQTTFQHCCLRNPNSGCLKSCMEIWRRKKSVRLSRIYSLAVKIYHLFHDSTKCCLVTVRKCPPQVKQMTRKRKRLKPRGKSKLKETLIIVKALVRPFLYYHPSLSFLRAEIRLLPPPTRHPPELATFGSHTDDGDNENVTHISYLAKE